MSLLTQGLTKLVEFLHHGNTQIRQIAAENLVPYSKNFPSIFQSGQCTPIKDLKLLIKDYPPIAKNALTILINLSSEKAVLKLLAEDDAFLESLLSRLTHNKAHTTGESQNPKEPNANDFAMLLANMAKSDSIARLQSLRRPAVPALTSSAIALDQLIELFNKGANGGYNAAADYDYLGYVFADMVKFPPFVTYLTTAGNSSALPPICSLTAFITHPSPPRRLATSLLLRNLALSHPTPLSLLAPPVSLLSYLLLPLIGPDPPFTDEETEQLLPELQYLGSEQVRESNVDILKGLLEALYLLVTRGDVESEKAGKGREGKRVVKEAGTYLVIRELHLGVEDEGVREGCERLVDVLMGEEMERGEEKVGDSSAVEDVEEDDEEKIVEIF
ncbi:MAG: hypothetical protein Q9195_006934 [Heterodermia aff. obscurata]